VITTIQAHVAVMVSRIVFIHMNFAAGSFHMKKLRSELFFRNLLKNSKMAFCATLWGT